MRYGKSCRHDDVDHPVTLFVETDSRKARTNSVAGDDARVPRHWHFARHSTDRRRVGDSHRDIEACLRSRQSKLYHKGIRSGIARSTTADANENRDWRIYSDFGQLLVHEARELYADTALPIDLDTTVYAVDATTIDLCLSLFPWAEFRSTNLDRLVDVSARADREEEARSKAATLRIVASS